MFIAYKIEKYTKLSNGVFETTPSIITDFYGLSIKIGLGTKKDVFSFSVNNNHNKYFSTGNFFENGDRIKIYGKINSKTYTDSDLIIDGIIDGVEESQSTNNVIKIKGVNRTEQFLEGLAIITTQVGNLKTPAEILSSAINFHNNENKNFQITWNPNNPTTSPTPGKKSDGTDFPTYYATEFYKSMNLIFERYSSNEYTQDGNYYYYVDNNNVLQWLKRESNSDTILEETECNNISLNNSKDKIINSLVLYCGVSPKGVGIRAYVFEPVSKARDGTKWKFITSTNSISTTLMQTEVNNNPSSFNVDSNGWFPTSYPYTPSWSGTSVSNDEEYNASVVTQAITQGEERGNAYINKVKNSIITAKITLPITFEYVIGQLLTCNFPHYGLKNKELRIQEIQYTNYNIILSLEEDELN